MGWMGISWGGWGEWGFLGVSGVNGGDMGRNNNALTIAIQNYYEKLSIVKCD